MKYNSTRNRSVSVSAAQAIAQGISADGGLFVPESLPQYSYEDLCKLKEMTYQGRAFSSAWEPNAVWRSGIFPHEYSWAAQ